ncbi:MAG: hypothetical protein QOJ72_1261, partial [Nocardioidaceae bacterium]|nr:hypothetical protein [Nocardioidaceae bacterium]
GLHTCATHGNGGIYCWGYNADGELGTGNTTTSEVPVRAGSSSSWTSVDLGYNHTCATHSSGGIYCWGYNFDGQLGTGDASSRYSPAKIAS